MDLQLKGKRALVLGASSGIGRAVAEMLIAEGATVAISSSNEERIQKAAREMGAALALSCDLLKPGEARKLVEAASARLGGIDILVTNAGGPPKGDFAEVTGEMWREGFQGLWLSAVDAIQAALPGMKERRYGRILMVTSFAAKEPFPHLTVSNGLRAGLMGLAKSLCHEVAPFNITVNCLLPGYTRTERLMELGIAEEKITASIPARRLAEPSEFAALTAFMASPRAGYITGQMIVCDGGALRGF